MTERKTHSVLTKNAPSCGICRTKVGYHDPGTVLKEGEVAIYKGEPQPRWTNDYTKVQWKAFCNRHLKKDLQNINKLESHGCNNRNGKLFGWVCVNPDDEDGTHYTIHYKDGNRYNSDDDNKVVTCVLCNNRRNQEITINNFQLTENNFNNLFTFG
jgi:hypothetical protein